MPTPAAGDPGEYPSSGDLVSCWSRVVRACAWVTRTLTTRVENETGLSASSFLVLFGLLRSSEGSEPLSTLARQVAFTSGGFTKVADRLEQAGLIERRPSPADRRVTNAVLTPAGRALAERASAVFSAGLRELVLQRLGPDQLRNLAETMDRLSGSPPAE